MRQLLAVSFSHCVTTVAATASLQPKTTQVCWMQLNATQHKLWQLIAAHAACQSIPYFPDLCQCSPRRCIYKFLRNDQWINGGKFNSTLIQSWLNHNCHCHGHWKILLNRYQFTTIVHLCTRICNVHIPCVSQKSELIGREHWILAFHWPWQKIQ